MENYHAERSIQPINILIVFLIGIATALFIVASIGSFELSGKAEDSIIISTLVIYVVVVIAFLYPHKKKTYLNPRAPEIIEKIKEVEVEKPIVVHKEVIKYRDRPVEKKVIETQEKVVEVEKKVVQPIIIEKEKPEIIKSKFVGSSYNDRYHLRTCRFAGAIKDEYLIKEDDKKYFKLRGYDACKVCRPDKN